MQDVVPGTKKPHLNSLWPFSSIHTTHNQQHTTTANPAQNFKTYTWYRRPFEVSTLSCDEALQQGGGWHLAPLRGRVAASR